MEGWLPIFFLAVILKIPVFAAMYIIWYAVKAEPDTEDAPGEGEHGFRRWRRDPKRPRGPRRGGPHSGAERASPDCPPGGRRRVVAPEPATALAARAHRERS